MPKFEVVARITYMFEAENAQEAGHLVECGEMPRDHELVSAFVSHVYEVCE